MMICSSVSCLSVNFRSRMMSTLSTVTPSPVTSHNLLWYRTHCIPEVVLDNMPHQLSPVLLFENEDKMTSLFIRHLFGNVPCSMFCVFAHCDVTMVTCSVFPVPCRRSLWCHSGGAFRVQCSVFRIFAHCDVTVVAPSVFSVLCSVSWLIVMSQWRRVSCSVSSLIVMSQWWRVPCSVSSLIVMSNWWR